MITSKQFDLLRHQQNANLRLLQSKPQQFFACKPTHSGKSHTHFRHFAQMGSGVTAYFLMKCR